MPAWNTFAETLPAVHGRWPLDRPVASLHQAKPALPTAVYVAIALAVARGAFANLGVPAWVSLTADIVPLHWHGRYFSSRNMAMQVAGMVVTYPVGQLITRAGAPAGYQLSLPQPLGRASPRLKDNRRHPRMMLSR